MICSSMELQRCVTLDTKVLLPGNGVGLWRPSARCARLRCARSRLVPLEKQRLTHLNVSQCQVLDICLLCVGNAQYACGT